VYVTEVGEPGSSNGWISFQFDLSEETKNSVLPWVTIDYSPNFIPSVCMPTKQFKYLDIDNTFVLHKSISDFHASSLDGATKKCCGEPLAFHLGAYWKNSPQFQKNKAFDTYSFLFVRPP
jgi:hypothetical protein